MKSPRVLKRVRAEDPRKLVMERTTTVTAARTPIRAFGAAFGTPNYSTAGGGLHCGNGAHLICRYHACILVGGA